jgi:mycofactocin system glycosyltransferase
MTGTVATAASGAAVGPPTVPLPVGFRVILDEQTLRLAPDRLFGGSPQRGLRLSAGGRAALDELLAGPVRSRAAGVLARRLTDAGLAHPRPPALSGKPDVTVLVPAFDRTEALDGCLSAAGTDYPVLVVDDGSANPDAVAAVAAKHAATVVRRPRNGGPGAARNTGLAQIRSEFVAFLDSDCMPGPNWVEALCAQLADPSVAAVAPRIVALPSNTAAGRYAQARGSLDMGARPSRVAPGTRVPYVPTAALVIRTEALRALGDAAFDPQLRVGEDVDLIWRLHGSGWRVRYDPAVRVGHREPRTWPALLQRRFRYGTSAGPLALRHPDAMPPLVLSPWAFTAVVGALTRRPALALAGLVGMAARTVPSLRRAGLPVPEIARRIADGTAQTWLGAGRYTTQFLAPALAAAVFAPRGRRGGRRPAVAALLLAGPLTGWLSRRPALDPARYAAASITDDIAYGCGVWVGSARARTAVAVRPALVRRSGRDRPAATNDRSQPGGHR